MAIEHLKRVEEHLRKNPKWYTRNKLRDELEFNFRTLCESLDYLIEIGRIVQKRDEDKGYLLYKIK